MSGNNRGSFKLAGLPVPSLSPPPSQQCAPMGDADAPVVATGAALVAAVEEVAHGKLPSVAPGLLALAGECPSTSGSA